MITKHMMLYISTILFLTVLAGCMPARDPHQYGEPSADENNYIETGAERWEDRDWEEQNTGRAAQDWED